MAEIVENVAPEGKIVDYIDNTLRNDTPEEYVRQTIEKRLVNEHRYKRSQICVEFPIKMGSRKSRADIVVFPDETVEKTQDNVLMVIECKRESTEPNSKKDGIEQLKTYMSVCPSCKWGMWTNGRQKDVFLKVEHRIPPYDEYNDIPSADGNLAEVDRPKRSSLKNAYGDNLVFAFRTCHNHIYANDGLQKQTAFFELLKVIFCKIEDERNIGEELEFYATSKERATRDGQLTVMKRISKIFERVKAKYGKIFPANDKIDLQPRSLAYIVSELQKYSLLKTNIDYKSKAYEEIVGSNLRGDRGEFFTPRNITCMTVKMINPQKGERVLDSSCGTGGFLVMAMTYVINHLEMDYTRQLGRPKELWSADERRIFQERVGELCSTNFFGFDINPDLVKATKMNMVMNDDGSSHIFQANSLLPPHEWSDEFREKLADALHIEADDLRNQNTLGYFDVIVTNPPFGSKIPIKDRNILEQFELAQIWAKEGENRWVKTGRLQSSVPPEILFIERCVQFLKPGGRLGIVLPDSLLGSPGLGYIREWLIRNTFIIASIDLDADTFQPRNGTQTSVLILQKKSELERARGLEDGRGNYNIFMAMVDKTGHDKRGNPIYKRDGEGNEILVPDEESEVEYMTENGATIAVRHKKKVPDDQTVEIPDLFREWKAQEGIAW